MSARAGGGRSRPLRVLHLVGSAVDQHLADLSLLYARDCLEHTAEPARYEPVLAHVSPDGTWRFPEDASDAAIAAAPPLPLAAAVDALAGAGIDVALPQMFCLPGMTRYRALLDLLGIAYVGNTPEAMALTADKARAKAVVAAAGVAVPAGEVLRAGQEPTIAPPAVVKPVGADNSQGLALVRERGQYPAALAAALEHGGAALVEEYVPLGREVRCGVLERDGHLVCLPLEEYAVDSATKPVRGVDDKLARGDDGTLSLVAKDTTRAWIVDGDDPLVAAVHEMAVACHVALGCRDYSLFDVRVDPGGRPFFLEAGLYCSFARQSVVPTMAAAAGTDLTALLADSIAGALAR